MGPGSDDPWQMSQLKIELERLQRELQSGDTKEAMCTLAPEPCFWGRAYLDRKSM